MTTIGTGRSTRYISRSSCVSVNGKRSPNDYNLAIYGNIKPCQVYMKKKTVVRKSISTSIFYSKVTCLEVTKV